MKILVLGGTGAIGVPVVRLLADKGNEVYVTTRRPSAANHGRIHYIIGNAQDMRFVEGLLRQWFDVIIDFMVYTPEIFSGRMERFLSSTGQYLFLSSARVYADAGERLLTEESPRLLDVIKDRAYLKTDEYALAKAREEDMLWESGYKNWTIIRPYITYNNHRLQLGVLEKEAWLSRLLKEKRLVFSRDIARHYTTLTHGEDVALRIAGLAGCGAALGETFHIAGRESVRWGEVLEIYLDVLEKKTGRRPEVYWLENAGLIAGVCHNAAQIKYDRLYDRRFDSSKIDKFSHEKVYVKTAEGLRKCLFEFLEGDRAFLGCNWKLEGAFDKVSREHVDIRRIPSWRGKFRYFQGYMSVLSGICP